MIVDLVKTNTAMLNNVLLKLVQHMLFMKVVVGYIWLKTNEQIRSSYNCDITYI